MTEFSGLFRSHTYQVEDFLSLDDVIEQNLTTLAAEGYELHAGPIITQAQDGKIWFTNVFRRLRENQNASTTMHGFN
ncbi:hypothetical protein MTQ12_13590 [Brevibacterium sp. R8603A2]|uniref:hypothetical protein n=1 Tax=Brevibacterium sp. R8603A2 TaxID=2929779 RepID=UPI001FF7BB9A|nr:hypothetical protein [Brevibacterium sp. R8603A2]MCK1804069.1 hypothetical protein [Brevibacterium sp. R8603A2]